MCFVLYAGTVKPIPRKTWQKDAPDVNVESLNEHNALIAEHFTSPEVQYVGSTSGCGCDFPYANLYNGEWPMFSVEQDPEQAVTIRHNREALVALLCATGDKLIELYGIWDGDYTKAPKSHEEITVEKILDPDFYFKEQGFYKVIVGS